MRDTMLIVPDREVSSAYLDPGFPCHPVVKYSHYDSVFRIEVPENLVSVGLSLRHEPKQRPFYAPGLEYRTRGGLRTLEIQETCHDRTNNERK